ncbi:DUF1361 domain-containing protein [uncultured Chitinophaga sp.]|jgi:Predicted membrane protein|uniref:DUF1361 domain-containing protein n=1 Tax=uncultured Chitinophaga sp. TaxID=339340 RepID=UPI002624887A|nr:DUF1361 domain-containing protein [uncultured Chitinophaga sp.]
MRMRSDVLVINKRNALLVSVSFSIALLLVRIIQTGSQQYAFLLWNLFLAWVPFLISSLMTAYTAASWRLPLWIPAVALWITYLPNAPYILTDLVHLPEGGAPVWFDLILILSFAWSGLIMGFQSIRQMQDIVLARFPRWPVQLYVFPVMMLCGWGIYIGRFLRWNSWDLVVRPGPLLQQTSRMVLHPIEHLQPWSFSVIMGLFLYLLYSIKFNR